MVEGQPPARSVTESIQRLTDHDRLVVRESHEEIVATPPSKGLGYLGCPVALLGIVIFVLWPQLLGVMPAASFFTPFAMLAAVLMVIGGPVAGFASGGFVRGRSTAAVEAALRQLESGDGDRDVMLRASTLLISHAFVSQGPTTSQTYEVVEVMPRIGDELPVVLAVEAYLVEELGVHRVFTLPSGEDGEEGG